MPWFGVEFDHNQVLEIDRLVEAFYVRCADRLAVPRGGLDTMLAVLDKVPGASVEALRAAIIQPQHASSLSAAECASVL